jgi:hypothetical protein
VAACIAPACKCRHEAAAAAVAAVAAATGGTGNLLKVAFKAAAVDVGCKQQAQGIQFIQAVPMFSAWQQVQQNEGMYIWWPPVEPLEAAVLYVEVQCTCRSWGDLVHSE